MGIRLRRELLPSGTGPLEPELRFEGPQVRVGRSPDAHLRLEEEVGSPVSRQHARIVWRTLPGLTSTDRDATADTLALEAEPADVGVPGWWLEDLGSRNGTFLNEARIQGPHPLRSGDRVRFGPGGPVFRVSLDAEASSPPTRETSAEGRGRRGAVAALLLVTGGLALLAVGVAVVDPRPDAAPRTEGGSENRSHWETADRSVTDGLASQTGGGASRDDGGWERALDPGSGAEASEARGPVAGPGPGAGAVAGPAGSAGTIRATASGTEAVAAALSPVQDSLARQARRAVALVWVEDTEGEVVTGTAFATRPDGLLITVRHLVLPDANASRPRRIGVQFADSEQVWEARLEGVSTEVDLAVLRVVTLPWDQIPRIDALNLRPDTLGPGAPVVVVGFAEGGTGEAEGRGLARPVSGAGELEAVTPTQLRIRGPGASGASGSPVLDAAGAVVGVVYGGVQGEVQGPDHHRLVAVNAVQVARFLARFPVQRRQTSP